MAAPTNSLIQECSTCGALLDVSGEEPFALMHCPTCGAAMRVRRHFDHFEIQEELGAGGMGTVYRALDLNLSRPVALKLLQRENSENPEYIAQFQKEAAITASINHPHVVKVYSTGQDHGLVYIAMELVDKGSLETRMESDEKLTEAQVLGVGIQIAQGLQAALERGLIHRDIKPGNILFADAGTAKIVDFGLAVLQEHAGHVAGEVWATPFYVAPETLEGKREDFRSDLYSLGATLFHVLAGKPPHLVETNSMSALAAAKKAPVNLAAVAPTVSSTTAFALHKSLSYDPAQRQQSYAEFIEHLEFAKAGLLGILPKDTATASGVLPKERDYRWLIYLTAAITVAGGVSAFQFRDYIRGRAPASEQTAETSGRKVDGEMTYEKARQSFANGEIDKAREAFSTLDTQSAISQPQRNWITFHAAMADFLTGHQAEAQAHLTTLVERGLYSPDPAEQSLAAFFVDTATRATGDQAIPAELAQDVDRRNYEALALLLYGLKDWAIGQYDEAWTLFRQYAQITPDPRYAWVADYKSLVQPLLGEVNAYRNALDAANSATTLQTRQQALEVVTASRARIISAGPLAKRLDQRAQELQARITSEQEEIAARIAAIEAADGKALADARRQITLAVQQFRPHEALEAMSGTKVTSEKAQQEREDWIKKLSWLTRFKATLVNDLNVVGYPSSVLKKSGSLMPGPIRHATDTQIETITPFGTLSALWIELSPESVIAMARSYVRPEQSPEILGEREWLLGVYEYFTGKTKESHDLLALAAQAAPQHHDDLALFENTALPK
jgi:serine/threonine protein kinase